jgi:endogenous inhibitor of DNA gyrase (YacG/DUF329 family)
MVEPVYQHLGEVFIFTVYSDRVTIRRRGGLDETKWCAVCGKPLEQPSTGRRRKYCSDRCRKRDARTRAKRLKSVAEAQSEAKVQTHLAPGEEISIPLMDIQATSGSKDWSVMTIWTGLTTGQSFYVGNREEFEALWEAIYRAEQVYLDELNQPVEG